MKAPPLNALGSVGDCFDNAMAESFFATLECELIDRRVFRTQAEARMAIFAVKDSRDWHERLPQRGRVCRVGRGTNSGSTVRPVDFPDVARNRFV